MMSRTELNLFSCKWSPCKHHLGMEVAKGEEDDGSEDEGSN